MAASRNEWLGAWDELKQKAASNPFAVVVMAQLMAQQIRYDSTERLSEQCGIEKGLQKGW